MEIHVATLFTMDRHARLLHVNDPSTAGRPLAAPRFFLGRTAEGNVWRFRSDLDPQLAHELDAICKSEAIGADYAGASGGAALFESQLAKYAPVTRTWTGPAFCFPDDIAPAGDAVALSAENAHCLLAHLPAWGADIALGLPFFGVFINGAVVSVCCSARTTAVADEAGVETAAPFRGRGYAAIAVRAWASAVQDRNRIPLYSTSWDNSASLALARKLGLRHYGTDLHIA
jgi:hypothetical protein